MSNARTRASGNTRFAHRIAAKGAERVTEVAVPAHTTGWVVVGRSAGDGDRALLAQAGASLNAAGLATLTIDLPQDSRPAAAWVQVAAANLRREMAAGLPVAYLGTGARAGAGWMASLSGDLDGVLAWNARPGAAWAHLRHVQAPSLLVVDHGAHDLPWRLLVARAVSWQLGGADIEAVGGSPLDPGVLARWYWDHLLSPAPLMVSPRALASGTRKRVATIGLAAALFAPVLAAAPAGASALPDFSLGSRLPALHIGGDTARAAQAGTRAGQAAVRRLTATDIGGDQASLRSTGSAALLDSSGLKWFLNDNITFSTTSSASAAMSEASYANPVAATTQAGGTTQSSLNDAFDGYQSMCVAVDNAVTASCATGNAHYVIYNKNGIPTTSCLGTVSGVDREVDFNGQTIDGLTVSRRVFVPDDNGFARWLDVVTNPGSSPADLTLEVANNLGSDSHTKITGDSAGDLTPTTSSLWATSFQDYSGTTSSDVRLGHVFGGPGATIGLAGLHFVNLVDKPYWGYTLTVPAGGTRIVMNYGVGQPTNAAAQGQAAALSALTAPDALGCMTPTDRAEVVNFAIPATAAPDAYSTPHDTALSTPSPGVLANDADTADLTAVLAAAPAHAASFALNADGSFTYTPVAGYAGADSFTYQSKSAGGGLSPATTVALSVVGIAPAVTTDATTPAPFTVGQAGSFTIRTTGTPTAVITSGPLPEGLTFKDNGDGTATISGTPVAGTQGSPTVTITVTNGQGSAATQMFTFAIAPAAVVATSPPTPTPTPPSPSPSPAPQLPAPPAIACASRRDFAVHLRYHFPAGTTHHGVKIVGASLVNGAGRSVHKTAFTTSQVALSLRGLAKATYRLRISLSIPHQSKHRTITLPYRTC